MDQSSKEINAPQVQNERQERQGDVSLSQQQNFAPDRTHEDTDKHKDKPKVKQIEATAKNNEPLIAKNAIAPNFEVLPLEEISKLSKKKRIQ